MAVITNFLHSYDLPADLVLTGDLAIDTEALGLNNKRDRLCVVQISDGKGDAHLVHFPTARYDAPNLKRILSQSGEKILHFARFDVAIIQEYLGVLLTPVYCTRTASRLVRTYTDRHGLKDICKEFLGIEISKQQQSSDWGALTLSKDQIDYAASDVLYLHELRAKLQERLIRENRSELARITMDCLQARALLDLAGWAEIDIFAHS